MNKKIWIFLLFIGYIISFVLAKIIIDIPTDIDKKEIFLRQDEERIYIRNNSKEDMIVNLLSGKYLSWWKEVDKFIIGWGEEKEININVSKNEIYEEMYYIIKYYPILAILEKESSILLHLIRTNSIIIKYKPMLDKILEKISRLSKMQQYKILKKVRDIKDILRNKWWLSESKRRIYMTILWYLEIKIKELLEGWKNKANVKFWENIKTNKSFIIYEDKKNKIKESEKERNNKEIIKKMN